MSCRPQGALPPVLLGTVIALGLMVGLVLALIQWGKDPKESADLRRGIQVVRYLSSPKMIRRSSFLSVHPQGQPSDFVNWMFSSLGTAEWPPSEEMAEQDPIFAEQAKAIRAPLLPRGIRLVAHRPEAGAGRQVVVKANDAQGLIIAQGYESAGAPPVLTRQWRLRIPRD